LDIERKRQLISRKKYQKGGDTDGYGERPGIRTRGGLNGRKGVGNKSAVPILVLSHRRGNMLQKKSFEKGGEECLQKPAARVEDGKKGTGRERDFLIWKKIRG